MLEFFIGDKKFEIANSISIIYKIPKEKEEVINGLYFNKKYYVQSKVEDETLKSFLKYLEKDEIPEITKDNYIEYYQLCNEFGVLKDHLNQQQFLPLFYISNLINSYENQKIDKKNFEMIIAQNLDYYLTNFPNDVKSIQFSSLYNIFNHPMKNLKDQDLAYKFIINNETSDKQMFFVLLETLDADEMKSEENRLDACINFKDHFGFSPKNTEKVVLRLEDDFIKAKQTIQNLSKEKNHFQEEASKVKNELFIANQKIQNLIKEKSQLHEEASKAKSELISIQRKVKNLNKDNSELQEELSKVKSELTNSKQTIQNLSKKNNQLQEELSKVKNELTSSKQTIQNSNKDNNKLQEEISKVKNELTSSKQTIQILYKEKKQLQEEANKTLDEKRDSDSKLQSLRSILNTFKQRANQAKISDSQIREIWDKRYGDYDKKEWDQDISQGKQWDGKLESFLKQYEFKHSSANGLYDALGKLHYDKRVTKREQIIASIYQKAWKTLQSFVDSKEDIFSKERQDIADAKNIILWTLLNDLANLSIN